MANDDRNNQNGENTKLNDGSTFTNNSDRSGQGQGGQGKNNSDNFANDPERAREAGRKGGES